MTTEVLEKQVSLDTSNSNVKIKLSPEDKLKIDRLKLVSLHQMKGIAKFEKHKHYQYSYFDMVLNNCTLCRNEIEGIERTVVKERARYQLATQEDSVGISVIPYLNISDKVGFFCIEGREHMNLLSY